MSGRVIGQSLRRILRSFVVFAVGVGLCAAALLCAESAEAVNGLKTLLLSGFTTEAGIRKTCMYWPLLLLTGLSAGVSWKAAGRLGVGAPGQFILGVLLAMAGALTLGLPWWACLTLAALGGALWNGLAAAVKLHSQTGDIVCGVTLNFTALYLAQWLWQDCLSGLGENASMERSALPALQMGTWFSVSFGLLIAAVLCLALWMVMRFSVFGFEWKAMGCNREAAKRAGMPVKRNEKIAVALSGALSGLAGGLCLLSGITEPGLSVVANQMGFGGIAVALLSFSHPLGTAFAAFIAAGVYAGSQALPAEDAQEIAGILLAATLLGSAVLYGKKRKRHKN